LLPVFKSISEKYNVQLVVISNENPHFDLVNFKFIQWKKESEIEDLKKISIGLMPLEMDQWSEGKCGFKGLQYMALGIPTVVSPVGVNTKIVEHGINGFLAKDLVEWQAYLEQLILNSELRERIGRNGREKVISEFSVLAVKHNFIQLFTS
jgi:glycosyltransferase involved in cell wall biosynthesis